MNWQLELFVDVADLGIVNTNGKYNLQITNTSKYLNC